VETIKWDWEVISGVRCNLLQHTILNDIILFKIQPDNLVALRLIKVPVGFEGVCSFGVDQKAEWVARDLG